MKRLVILFGTILFLCGCFAIIDDSSETRKVKNFGISKNESSYILDQANSKSDAEKKEIKFFTREKK